MKTVQHPCQGCVYFKACGQAGRAEPCKERQTKRETKKGKAK